MPFALSLSKGLFNVASNCVETEERGSDPARDSSASMRYLVNEIKGSSEQFAKTQHLRQQAQDRLMATPLVPSRR